MSIATALGQVARSARRSEFSCTWCNLKMRVGFNPQCVSKLYCAHAPHGHATPTPLCGRVSRRNYEGSLAICVALAANRNVLNPPPHVSDSEFVRAGELNFVASLSARPRTGRGPHRLVVRTSRCGRDNPGSTPGVVIFLYEFLKQADMQMGDLCNGYNKPHCPLYCVSPPSSVGRAQGS